MAFSVPQQPRASSGTRDGAAGAAAPQKTPGPVGLVSFEGHADPLGLLGHLIDRYGDVFRYQTCFGPVLFFNHPEHVQTVLHREQYRRASLLKMVLGDGLLASDGPRWRSQRRLMQPDFLPPAVAPFTALMSRETNKTAAAWELAARERKPINIASAMTRLTLRVIVEALFSDDLPEERSAELCKCVTQTIKDVGNISWSTFGAPALFTADRNATFNAAKGFIDTLCYDMAARRRALAPENRPRDLLTLLIEADGESGPMTDRQLRDEIVTMLVGGHETTALSISWAWKVLAEDREIEAALHRELDEVLAGRTPTLADLPQLTWTKAIFQEAMRLYPPVWYMARVADKDDVIHGHAVPKGATVLVAPWFTHRHKDFWPEPERFDPSRFLDPADRPAHRYAYFPFGGGRHQCLGMQFALMEGTIILAQLAQQFCVRPTNAGRIKPDPGVTLRQVPELEAIIEMRGAHDAAHPKGRQPA